jgi:hypothetical protein
LLSRAHLLHGIRPHAALVLALILYLGAFAIMRPAPVGDEPHYLIVAGSIVLDGDLDLRNDYASRDRVLTTIPVFPLTPPHAYHYAGNPELRTFHGIGLSLLLAPGVFLDRILPLPSSWRGYAPIPRLEMILLAALLATSLLRLLEAIRVVSARTRWLAWVAVVGCLPLIVFSNQFYPEVPAALITVYCAQIVVRTRCTPRPLFIAASLAAFLPWLHFRYVPIAGILFCVLTYWAVRKCSRSRLRSCLTALAVPFVVSMGSMGILFEKWYGSPLPNAPYRPFHERFGGAGWSFFYQNVIGATFDPLHGWIPYQPVALLGLAGLGVLIWRLRWPAVVGVLGVLLYLTLVAAVNLSPGYQFPARLQIAVIPLIIVPLAVLVELVRESRLIFFPLLALSLVFSIAAVAHYQELYPSSSYPSQAQLFGVRSIQTAFPTTKGPQSPDGMSLTPSMLLRNVGSVRGPDVVASARRGDPAGYLVFGPYLPLRSGVFVADFSIAGHSSNGRRPIAQIDVNAPGRGVLASRRVFPLELPGNRLRHIILPFSSPTETPIETRVFYTGLGTLRVVGIEVEPAHDAAASTPVLRDWPTVFLWVTGTCLAGWLFVVLARRGNTREEAAGVVSRSTTKRFLR